MQYSRGRILLGSKTIPWLLCALLALPARLAMAAESSVNPDSPLATFLEWFPGEYDNCEQTYSCIFAEAGGLVKRKRAWLWHFRCLDGF